METKNVSCMFLAAACCFIGTVFSSCDDNDNNYDGDPVTTSDVRGVYADANMSAGDADTTVTVNVDADSLTIVAFPVDGIVAAVLPQAEQAGALETTGDVTFAAAYDAEVIGGNVVMALSPDTLQFTMEANGQECSVKVAFAEGSAGIYSGRSGTLSLKFTAEKVILDGDTVPSFEPIEYFVSPTPKESDDNEGSDNVEERQPA